MNTAAFTYCIVVRRRMQHAVRARFVWHVAKKLRKAAYNFSICSILRQWTATYGAVHCRTWAYGDVHHRTILPRACVQNASSYAVWTGFTTAYIDTRRRTIQPCANCVNVWHCMQGWRKQRKLQSTPLIRKMLYHGTNSSHQFSL